MASGDFNFGTPNYLESELDTDWNAESSQFIWDSPQPDPPSAPEQASDLLPDTRPSAIDAYPGPAASSARQTQTAPQTTSTKVAFTTQSSPSETSSHSSSSASSAQRKRKASNVPAQASAAVAADEALLDSYKMDKMFSGMDDAFTFDDSNFPTMGAGMDNLSLDSMAGPSMSQDFNLISTADSPNFMNSGLFVDKPLAFSPRNFAPTGTGRPMNASPLTVQPSKTFFLSESRGQSPNSTVKMESHESSPAAFFNENSPMSGSGEGSSGMSSGMSGHTAGANAQFDKSGMTLGVAPGSLPNSLSPASASQPRGAARWPCLLTVDATPEKSRVETQIPIRLTLHDVPSGITKLHLPSHTISKPKFQAKPPFTKSDDTLELSTMLVCASALQKDGVEDRAFRRALVDEVPVKTEETQLAGVADQPDDDDPNKPLNGGPVTICQGCIVRERKRAARKKTKKVEEEEEWAKDEAKRVIVFNCGEVRDWCVPGTKETAVKEHDMPLDVMFVNAPMRIACYCRHQSEKVGFQVIFTIKTSDGQVLAQAISNSIMITDDHKQPLSHTGPAVAQPFNGPAQIPGSGVFTSGPQAFGMYPTFSQDMPFRPSWSTNDLRLLGNQFSQQQQQHPGFPQQYGAIGRSQQSTASVTPRNLSRPASPTDPSGHSTKKRKSGGPVKVPAGLTMTRIENRSPPATGPGTPSAPPSTGPSSGTFNFTAPVPTSFGTPLEQTYSNSMRNFSSGPPTPLIGSNMLNNTGGFGSPIVDADPYQYFSAPTSQHASRAPSPNTGSRAPSGGNFQNPHVAQQTAMALASLPAGLNLHRPPIIQRLIPNAGARSGGDEVTVLGSGFFQGLDVMFGDNLATNTTFWGDTTLVCRAPPSATVGPVSVVFKHQHASAPPMLREVQALLPTRLIAYNYYDTDKQQLHGLAVGVASQHQNIGGNMSQESLSQGFFNNQAAQARVPKFSRVNSSGRVNQRFAGVSADIPHEGLDLLSDDEFENALLQILNANDVVDSPYEPRYDQQDKRGATMLSLAAGLGYTRFVAGLLVRGATVDVCDHGGYTALMMASLRGHAAVVRRLLMKGADPSLRSLKGYTAADLATSDSVLIELSGARTSTTATLRTMTRPRQMRRPSSTASLDSLSTRFSSSQLGESVILEEEDDDNDLVSFRSSVGKSIGRSPALQQRMLPTHLVTNPEGQNRSSEESSKLAASQALSQLTARETARLHLSPKGGDEKIEQCAGLRHVAELLLTMCAPAVFAAPPAYEDIFPERKQDDHSAENTSSSSLVKVVEKKSVGSGTVRRHGIRNALAVTRMYTTTLSSALAALVVSILIAFLSERQTAIVDAIYRAEAIAAN